MKMDSLIQQTKALSWEDHNLTTAIETAKETTKLALVGIIVATRPLNKISLHASFKAAWNFIKKFHIKDLNVNLFLFTFKTSRDKQRIINQAQWNFKGHLLILKLWLAGFT